MDGNRVEGLCNRAKVTTQVRDDGDKEITFLLYYIVITPCVNTLVIVILRCGKKFFYANKGQIIFNIYTRSDHFQYLYIVKPYDEENQVRSS